MVLAKIHVGDMVRYITDPMETVIFVPSTEFDEDECVSGKWATILSLVKGAWEAGKTDIYAVVRLGPDSEFVLTTKEHGFCLQLPPLDEKTGRPLNGCDKCPMVLFRPVGVKELNGFLNG